MALSFATRSNSDLLDQNYELWRKDPASVDATWAAFFEGFELGNTASNKNGSGSAPAVDTSLQTRVDGLVYAYRTLGHTIAQLDPLAHETPRNPLLSLRELGFAEKDLDITVGSKFYLGGQRMKLREMIASIESIYCRHIGVEFMHLQNPRVRNWVREKIESQTPEAAISAPVQRRMLRQLAKVESFEHCLHKKYVGQKRFSLEGSEALITALYGVLETAPERGVEEICMGMSHRGRLSVIAEFLRKPFRLLFAEFSENFQPNATLGDGDVKYHLGYAITRKLKTG